MDNFEEGQRVSYLGRDSNRIGGIVAELATSSLTGKPRLRVVDFHRERKDPEAGHWIYADQARSEE